MQRVTDEPSVSRGRTLRTRVSCRVLPLAVFYGCVVFFLSFKPLWLERLLGRHGIVSMRIPSVESCLMILKTFFFFLFFDYLSHRIQAEIPEGSRGNAAQD